MAARTLAIFAIGIALGLAHTACVFHGWFLAAAAINAGTAWMTRTDRYTV